MSVHELARLRRHWRELSAQEKHAVLAELRRRQQAQIELEVRELRAVRRR
jgi:predicted Fe-S protein YdhL (DUF1289 family)